MKCGASDGQVIDILAKAKRLAQDYRHLTGRPLGVTGEIAEYEAVRLLGLKLAPPRTAGYDASEMRNGQDHRFQIKGRCILSGSGRNQRMGSIDVNSQEWDAVLLVLLNEEFEATEIYEAPRVAVVEALVKPGSRARNERGALGIRQFMAIAHRRWPERPK